MEYRINLYLDKRRELKDGTYPIKLRIYSNIEQSQKLYNTHKSYSISDFEDICKTKVPKRFIEDSIYLNAFETKANNIAKNISPFNFELFERNFLQNRIDNTNIIDYFNSRIEEMYDSEQISNAKSYQSSLNAIKKFINKENPDSVRHLHIMKITKEWLGKFEKYIHKERGLSISTVGGYLRPLRAVYNIILKDNPMYEKLSPFSDYQLPSSKTVNKALSKGDLRILLDAEPKTEQQQRAKDFWFFSLYGNGMNINDIARLEYKDFDFKAGKFSFYRHKTFNSKRGDLKRIVVHTNEYLLEIINKYKNEYIAESQFIFPILKNDDTELIKKNKIGNFIRFINQHIKTLAKENEITDEISVNWARHTFTTLGVNQSLTLEELMQFLGHSNIKTTQSYVGTIEDENQKILIDKIYNF